MSKVKRVLLSKSVLSIFVTAGIIAVLIFASSPAQALTISVSNSANAYQGSPYTFTVTINVEDSDLLPIRHVDLQISNVNYPDTYKATLENLPLTQVSTQSHAIKEGATSGSATVAATTGSGWGYGYGYGYGYGGYVGPATLTYQITWTPPSSFLTGTYNIKVMVYGNGSSTAFTHPGTYSFTLNVAPAVDAGYYATPPTAPGTTTVSNVVDSAGKFTSSVTAKSADGKVLLSIPN